MGCSFDSAAENKAFAEKFGYTFPLLCDTERKIGLAYGAATAPESGNASRMTYIIDEQGKIAHALTKIDVSSHTEEMLALVR